MCASSQVLCTNAHTITFLHSSTLIHIYIKENPRRTDRQIIMIARWQAAVGSSSHPPTPLHKTLWPPSLKPERARWACTDRSTLRGVPKTRVHHLFVAWTPVICFLRVRRRLMRSDWPFNFAFINSVGWRLYRGFVRPGTNERVRQLVMKCPWIEGSISLPFSCFFSSFLFFFSLVFFFLLLFLFPSLFFFPSITENDGDSFAPFAIIIHLYSGNRVRAQ